MLLTVVKMRVFPHLMMNQNRLVPGAADALAGVMKISC